MMKIIVQPCLDRPQSLYYAFLRKMNITDQLQQPKTLANGNLIMHTLSELSSKPLSSSRSDQDSHCHHLGLTKMGGWG